MLRPGLGPRRHQHPLLRTGSNWGFASTPAMTKSPTTMHSQIMNPALAFKSFFRRFVCPKLADLGPFTSGRIFLYRLMGVRIGRDVYIGSDVEIERGRRRRRRRLKGRLRERHGAGVPPGQIKVLDAAR
jgi:hypothetical protein